MASTSYPSSGGESSGPNWGWLLLIPGLIGILVLFFGIDLGGSTGQPPVPTPPTYRCEDLLADLAFEVVAPSLDLATRGFSEIFVVEASDDFFTVTFGGGADELASASFELKDVSPNVMDTEDLYRHLSSTGQVIPDKVWVASVMNSAATQQGRATDLLMAGDQHIKSLHQQGRTNTLLRFFRNKNPTYSYDRVRSCHHVITDLVDYNSNFRIGWLANIKP